MAGLSQVKGRWRVTHQKRAKYFDTEQGALAYMAENGLERGRQGRFARTPEQILNTIADSSETDSSGCWVWQRRLTNEGYGSLTWQPGGKGTKVISGAHRLAYHVAVEPVPADMVVDHLCRNRACVNPDHLEVVVQRENVMRSPIAMGALNAAKTHCAKGHPFSPENTYVYNRPSPKKTTTRVCRTCANAYHRAYAARKRAAQNGAAA